MQVQRSARQADAAQGFAAQLRQPGERMLNAGAGLGDPFIAPLLGGRDRLVLAALALNMYAPALLA